LYDRKLFGEPVEATGSVKRGFRGVIGGLGVFAKIRGMIDQAYLMDPEDRGKKSAPPSKIRGDSKEACCSGSEALPFRSVISFGVGIEGREPLHSS